MRRNACAVLLGLVALVFSAAAQGAPAPASELEASGNFDEAFLSLCNVSSAPLVSRSSADFLGSLRYLELADAEIGYFRFGSGSRGRPPLILVPGFGATIFTWPLEFLSALAEDQEVIAYDNRGMGFSKDYSSGALTVLQMADDALNIVRALNLGVKPNILGWSMGGMITLSATAKGGAAAFDKVVVCAGTPGGWVSPTPSITAVSALLSDGPTTAAKINLTYPFLSDEAVRIACHNYFTSVSVFDPTNSTALQRQTQALVGYFLVNSNTAIDLIPDISNSVLMVGGDLDQIVPVGGLRWAAQKIQHSSLIVYRNAGHGSFLQYMSSFLASLDAFLDTVDFENDGRYQ